MGTTYICFAAVVIGGAAGWLCTQPVKPATYSGAARPVRAAAPPDESPAPAPVISAMTAKEVKSRLETILASPARDSQELQRLMLRWVAADPEGAKAWIRAFPDAKSDSYDSSSQPVKDFFRAWAELDPEAAMAEALAIGGEKSLTAQDAVIAGLARADFETIGEILAGIPEGKNNPREAVAGLMKQLMARDRPAALALAMSLKGAMGDGAVQGISSVWARTDPQGALGWAQQHPEASIRDNAAKTILTQWARHDPLSVGPVLLQKREGSPDIFHRDAAAEAVARLSESSPQAAAAFVAEFYPQDQLKANLSSLFFRLMQGNSADPQSAAAMCACVNLLPEEALKSAKVWQGSWMSDLKPSWDRILAEPDSPGRQFLLGEIGRKFSTQDPAQMVGDIMKEPDPAVREQLLRASFSGDGGFHSFGGEKQLAEFRQAVESMPDSVRSLGAAHLAWATAAWDPPGAAEVIRQYPEAAEAGGLIENMAIRMAGKMDLPAVQTWADSLPTPAAQGKGYSGIVSGNYSEDSETTSRWAQTLPPGPGRDGAASSLANYAREDDPEAAFAWADSIQDEKLRTDTAKGVLKSWAAADRAAAMEALEQSGFPAEQKSAILKTIIEPQ